MQDLPNDNDTDAVASQSSATLESGERTPKALREAIQDLMKNGVIEARYKPNVYRTLIHSSDKVNTLLEPLDLGAKIDEVRGLVMLLIPTGGGEQQDDWSHPLIRRQRLNLEQTLVLALLRQHYLTQEQNSGFDAGDVSIDVDELVSQLKVYLPETGSEARDRTRTIQVLDQLKAHGLVTLTDSGEDVVIRPLIVHLMNPENLEALLSWLTAQTPQADKAISDEQFQ
jgi:hypothetical protein